MKVDIVDFSGGGDDISAVYIEDCFYIGGDYYHNKITAYIEGWIDGAKSLGLLDEDITYYKLNEEDSEKFYNNGADFPSHFPFDEYELIKES